MDAYIDTVSHYIDVIMSSTASQITSLTIVYSNVYSGADQRKHQSSASLASVRGIHRWPVNSPHKEPVTWKFFPFDDVIMSHKINPSLPGRDGRHFTDNTLKCIFLNENIKTVILISLKFIPKDPIYKKSALVQVTAWGWIGDKPLYKLILTQFTHPYPNCNGDLTKSSIPK